jgi:hypothetical protein
LRNATASFVKKLLVAIGFDGEFRLSFGWMALLQKHWHWQTSRFDRKTMTQATENQLQNRLPEPFKIFILALCAGLRRNEIDKLFWRQVNFRRRSISVQQTAYFLPKQKNRVPIYMQMMLWLTCWKNWRHLPLDSLS